MSKIIYYKKKPIYEGDITKNNPLCMNELDSNFFELKGDDIKNITLENGILTFERYKDILTNPPSPIQFDLNEFLQSGNVDEDYILGIIKEELDKKLDKTISDIEVNGIGSLGSFNDGDIIEAGVSLDEILSKIFRKRNIPTYKEPELSLEMKISQTEIEVGGKVTIELIPTYIPNDAGEVYRYVILRNVGGCGDCCDNCGGDCDGNDGCCGCGGCLYYDSDVVESKTFEVDANEEDRITFKALVFYRDGQIKQDNFGDVDENSQDYIRQNFICSNHVCFNGVRACFYGSNPNDIKVMYSEDVRKLNKTLNPTKGGFYDIDITEGDRCVVFCCPAKLGRIENIIQISSNINIISSFDITKIPVYGIDGFDAIDYNIYKLTTLDGLNYDVFRAKI